jgi:hypothetical protein
VYMDCFSKKTVLKTEAASITETPVELRMNTASFQGTSNHSILHNFVVSQAVFNSYHVSRLGTWSVVLERRLPGWTAYVSSVGDPTWTLTSLYRMDKKSPYTQTIRTSDSI